MTTSASIGLSAGPAGNRGRAMGSQQHGKSNWPYFFTLPYLKSTFHGKYLDSYLSASSALLEKDVEAKQR
jgi:hypothetical protein